MTENPVIFGKNTKKFSNAASDQDTAAVILDGCIFSASCVFRPFPLICFSAVVYDSFPSHIIHTPAKQGSVETQLICCRVLKNETCCARTRPS